MIYTKYSLTGRCKAELDTELRFDTATAKYDGIELVEFSFVKSDSEKENNRILCCIKRVLSAMRREGMIQFYVTSQGFENNTTEAAFLINKYSEYIAKANKNEISVYIKCN